MINGSSIAQFEEKSFTQRDRRAEGGARHIRMTRSDILISRRYSGVSMMIQIPVNAYRGVALDVRATAGGGVRYLLTLAHRDADLDILLAEIRDGDAVAAEWKYWATLFGLPRLMVGDNGEAVEVGAAGPMAENRPVARRPVVAILKRRPRFLTRRKTGAPARMQEVFADEREIISYE